MVFPSRIHCRVIAIPLSGDRWNGRAQLKPSELVPWADPYIAGLISKLQSEVRGQRQLGFHAASSLLGPNTVEIDSLEDAMNGCHQLLADEAEMPWNDEQYDFDPPDEDRLPDFENGSDMPT